MNFNQYLDLEHFLLKVRCPVKWLLIVLFTLNNVFICSGQRILVLKKSGKAKSIRFALGNAINFKLKNDKIIYSGIITQLSDSSFKLTNQEMIGKEIPINTVEQIIDYKKGQGFKLISRILIYAGAGFLVVDAFNRAINSDVPFINERTVTASGILMGTGILLIPLTRKKYKIGPERTLKILDFTL